jgi:uncharacterized integral membrane protein
MQKTRGRRESYLISGTIMAVLGIILLAGGTESLSCSLGWTGSMSCSASVLGFLIAVIGGLLLGAAIMILMVGFALGEFVYVTR